MAAFHDEDEFYRAIKRSQPSVICQDGSISSALFKNEDTVGNPGISVDCQDGRSREEAICFLQQFFAARLKAAVSVLQQDISACGALVFRSPSSSNPHHAEIFKNESKEHISNLQAFHLARQCKLCYFAADIGWVQGNAGNAHR